MNPDHTRNQPSFRDLFEYETVEDSPADIARAKRMKSEDIDPFADGRMLFGQDAQDHARERLAAALGEETISRAVGRPSVGATTAQGQSVQHQVRFDPTLDEQLRSYATSNNLSLSEAIRACVRAHIATHYAA